MVHLIKPGLTKGFSRMMDQMSQHYKQLEQLSG